jgi:hypothetical protein
MAAHRRPRSWRYLVGCLRDPPRSDFAFVPHQYISAPLELSDALSELSPSDENTPINSSRYGTPAAHPFNLFLSHYATL